MDESDTAPAYGGPDRRSGSRRRAIQYDNRITLGTIATIVALTLQALGVVVGAGMAYGTYRSDQAEVRKDIKAAGDISDIKLLQLNGQVGEVKADVRDIRARMDQIGQAVQQIQATQQARGLQPQR